MWSLLILLISGPSDGIAGVWETEDRTAQIEIYEQGQAWYGRIVTIDEAKLKFTGCASETPRSAAALVGRIILTGLRSRGDGRSWNGGTMTDPTNNKTYHCSAELADDRTLQVRVYRIFPWLGDTRTWKKVQ